MPSSKTRLHRSNRQRLIAGVCGGIAEYFDLNVTLVRFIFILLIFAHGFGLILYPVLWILMPPGTPVKKGKAEMARHRSALGIILLVVGLVWMLNVFVPIEEIDWRIIWSIVLLLLGATVAWKNRRMI